MNFQLDVTTAFISIVAGQIFTIVLITAYRHGQNRDRAVNTFYLAKWLQAIGWGIAIFKGIMPLNITVSLANTALFIGATLEAIALMRAIDAYNQKTRKLYIVLTGCCILIFHAAILFANSEENRIAIASMNTGLLLILPSIRMLEGKKSSMLMKLMGVMYIIIAIGAVMRAVLAWFTSESLSLYEPSLYQAISFLSLYILMFLGNIGFVLLSKEKADQELLHIASFDDLTGIWNRRTFMNAAEQAITNCYNKAKPVSMILMDIDHYKMINDTYGHDVGDAVLQEYSKHVQSVLRVGDLIGRYGGDEFAVLLPDTDEKQAQEVAEAIRMTMNHSNMNLPMKITLSLGITTSNVAEGHFLPSLMKQSDIALYRAKHRGRNQAARYCLEDRLGT